MAGNLVLLCGGALPFKRVMRREEEGGGEDLEKDKT